MNGCLLLTAANQDPVATIMGPAFASVGGVPGNNSTLLEVHERLAREKALGSEGEATDKLDSSFRLMLLINSLDLKLLHNSIKQMGKYVLYIRYVSVCMSKRGYMVVWL